jgi:hypothetical protein
MKEKAKQVEERDGDDGMIPVIVRDIYIFEFSVTFQDGTTASVTVPTTAY